MRELSPGVRAEAVYIASVSLENNKGLIQEVVMSDIVTVSAVESRYCTVNHGIYYCMVEVLRQHIMVCVS